MPDTGWLYNLLLTPGATSRKVSKSGRSGISRIGKNISRAMNASPDILGIGPSVPRSVAPTVAVPVEKTPEDILRERLLSIHPANIRPLETINPSDVSYPSDVPTGVEGIRARDAVQTPFDKAVTPYMMLASLTGGIGSGINAAAGVRELGRQRGAEAQQLADARATQNFNARLSAADKRAIANVRLFDSINDSINAANQQETNRVIREQAEAGDIYGIDMRSRDTAKKSRMEQAGRVIGSILSNPRFNAASPAARNQIIKAITSTGLTTSDLFDPNTNWMLGLSMADRAKLENALTIARERNATSIKTSNILASSRKYASDVAANARISIGKMNADVSDRNNQRTNAMKLRIADVAIQAKKSGLINTDAYKAMTQLRLRASNLENNLSRRREAAANALKQIDAIHKEPSNRGSNNLDHPLLDGLNQHAAQRAMMHLRNYEMEVNLQEGMSRDLTLVEDQLNQAIDRIKDLDRVNSAQVKAASPSTKRGSYPKPPVKGKTGAVNYGGKTWKIEVR